LADLIKFAFVAGEISPTLFSRSDLEKYDLAVALARNWFVDYRGGMSTRPGSKFQDFVMQDEKPTKFVPFKFAPDAAQTYVCLFGHEYVRFIQSGAYVLEADKAITAITQASPGVVTSAAHGYSNGDWVKIYTDIGMNSLNGRTFKVANVAANTFELTDPNAGANVDTTAYVAYTSGATVARIYTVTTPYDADDLELLRAHQSRSSIYLTHPDYKPRTLVRDAHTTWVMDEVDFGAPIGRPASAPTIDAGAGSAGVAFQVTAVNADGAEGIPSDYGFDTTAVDYSSVAGSAKVTWTGVTGALLYRVYRTNIVPTGAQATRNMQVGFVGIAYGTEFIDNNIVPDFTVTPPTHLDPFADGAIEYIEVTAGGTGYTNASVVSITTSTGSGFIGYPVVNTAGNLVAIAIVKGGKGYVSGDTIAVTVGTGATFNKTLTEASGNNPAVSSVFQQRKIYAASDNDPLTIWASKPGEYETMDVSTIIQEDDSYEFELDSDEVAPIRHLLSTRSGLVIISQAGIWQLTGGGGVAVTPTNALADPQSYTGCSILPPLPIDTDILYQEGKGATVRLLTYNDYTKVFAGQDLSILSNHLVLPSKPLKAWAYASDPFKLVHAVRSDGTMLNLTLVKEQNVYGWTSQTTRGLYKDVIAIQEDQTDVVYTVVQRLVNGRWTKFLETFARREFTAVEDAWCLDCAVTNEPNYPAATLTPAAATGSNVIFTASAGVFTVGDVGKVIRVGGGKANIVNYNSATEVEATIMQAITNVVPEDPDDTPVAALEGEWTLDEPFSEVTGLWHLEGMTVRALADGNYVGEFTVTNGSIDILVNATRIIVGIPYTCVMQTLPPTAPDEVIEGRRKIIKGVQARVHNSRGLKSGPTMDRLMPMKERTDEQYAEPTRLQNGVKPLLIPAEFNREAQTLFVVEEPLPATVLGFVLDLKVADVKQSRG
jgi:hypothetical protein